MPPELGPPWAPARRPTKSSSDPGIENLAAVLPSPGSQIDDPVGAGDEIEGCARPPRLRGRWSINRRRVRCSRSMSAHMKTGGRLIEEKEAPTELSLCAAATERRKVASFSRWASPPERVAVDWPSRRYPNPTSTRACRRRISAWRPAKNSMADSTDELERLGDVAPLVGHFENLGTEAMPPDTGRRSRAPPP